MSGVRIDITADSVTPWLNGAIRAVADPQALLDAIGATVANNTKLRFHDGRAPDGTPWQAVLRGGQPLRDTGVHLMNTVSHQVQGNSVLVGVSPFWAAVHQFGATIKAKNVKNLKFQINGRWVQKPEVTIPARPFLGISEQDGIDIQQVIVDAITQGASA